jgi:hypothetical protein
MKKFLLFIPIFCITGISVFATIPTGYYSTLEGKKAAALKTELHKIICQDTTHYLGYGSGLGNTWQGFYSTDRDVSTNLVIDMYSNNLRYFATDYTSQGYPGFGSTIEIEHSVPKSWWGCDITHPDCPAKDLNHLYPADGTTNMSKNDNPLGVVTGTPTTDNGLSKVGPGGYDGYVGNVFEPADQFKGDFARSYFYMATAYEHYVNKWDTSKPENMMMNNTYPVLKPGAIKLLLQWHHQDVVSIKEVTRNETVYGIQKNRNPFIDHPELIDYIWGDKTTIPYRLDGIFVFPYLKWPNDNDTINLGKVSYSLTKDTVISVQAMNLTGDLTLSLGGANSASFSVDKTTITKEAALNGDIIGIHYQALGVGNQSAILTISGGGITPVFLKLKVFSSDEFAALTATNTGNNSFVANWTPSVGATGYSLNVYTFQNLGVTNPSTVLEEDFNLSLPNGWVKEGYADSYTLAGNIKLGTASLNGKITTPALDLSTAPSILTVRAKQYGNDNGAPLTATIDNATLAVWTTAVANQDFTVNIPISTTISKVGLSCLVGKRVYVDYVKLVSLVPVLSPVPITGFPKQLGNVLSYKVTGLLSGKNYYYYVTPQGNGASPSNQVMVQTVTNTAVDKHQINNITYSVLPQGVLIQNLPADCKLNVLNLLGYNVLSLSPTTPQLSVSLPQKGIYLLQVQQKNQLFTFKILY